MEPKDKMRKGQIAFNELHAKDPKTANAIRGTSADPFYNDARLPAFYLKVKELQGK